MPKIVDHEKQRRRVAEAAMRIIRRGGLEQASVRNIAEEAGLSVGSMRHYFASQAELFAYCMNLFLVQIEERIKAMKFDGPLLTVLKQLIFQFLPVDEERRTEMEVWFTFNAKTLVYPELKELSDDMYKNLLNISGMVIDQLIAHKWAKPGLDADIEREKLYALIDGLAIHSMLRPDVLTPDRLETIIDQHLQSLCREAPESPA
jgi:Uncharacterized protein conserved in bacteria